MVSDTSKANLQPPFSKTNQPPNRGRKPSKLRKYIKDNNLSAADIGAAAKFLLAKTQGEIQTLVADPKVPMLMRLFARSLLEDMKHGYLDNVTKLLDRSIGKPKDTVEISVPDGLRVDHSTLTEEEAEALFRQRIAE